MTYRVTLIPGDGIGPELADALARSSTPPACDRVGRRQAGLDVMEE